ncbi:MAG TPA: CvpA family protein [Cyclobacteriaceae bacterium]
MSIADIILGILILIGAYQGYKEGFLMSLFSLFAIILGVLGGFKLMGAGMILLANKFNVDKTVLPYISFAVIFVIIVIVVTLIGRTIQASIDKNFLGRVDQAMGGVLGLLKMVFMCSVLIWLVNSLRVSVKPDWIEGSWLYPKVAVFAPKLTNQIGKLIPLFKDVF